MGFRLKAKKGPNGRLHLCRRGRQLAKCGCGNGCCYCQTYNAKKGDPCYYGTDDVPYDCGPASCCCGKSWELYFSGQVRWDRIPYFPNQSYTGMAELHMRMDVEKVGEVCTVKRTIYIDRTQQMFDDGKEIKDDSANLWGTGNGVFGKHCRIGAYQGFATANVAFGAIVPTGGMYTNGECDGEHDFGQIHTEWSSTTACATGSVNVSQTSDKFNNKYVATLKASWQITRLDSECCGDGDGPRVSSGAPNLNPPGGNPGAPGGVQDGGCGGCGNGDGL